MELNFNECYKYLSIFFCVSLAYKGWVVLLCYIKLLLYDIKMFMMKTMDNDCIYVTSEGLQMSIYQWIFILCNYVSCDHFCIYAPYVFIMSYSIFEQFNFELQRALHVLQQFSLKNYSHRDQNLRCYPLRLIHSFDTSDACSCPFSCTCRFPMSLYVFAMLSSILRVIVFLFNVTCIFLLWNTFIANI